MSVPIDSFDMYANLSVDTYCLDQRYSYVLRNRVYVYKQWVSIETLANK